MARFPTLGADLADRLASFVVVVVVLQLLRSVHVRARVFMGERATMSSAPPSCRSLASLPQLRTTELCSSGQMHVRSYARSATMLARRNSLANRAQFRLLVALFLGT